MSDTEQETILKKVPEEYQSSEVCKIIAGSHLYGLNTPSSDIDYRIVYKTHNPVYIYGLRECKTICGVSEDVDETHYELRHFMGLMKKTNTQMAEMMFANDDACISCDHTFKIIRENKYSNSFKFCVELYVYFVLCLDF
jgi:predicted nucleotidyltransferase